MLQKIKISLNILFIIHLQFAQLVNTQQIPEVPCPNYFQYSRAGSTIIGFISLPQATRTSSTSLTVMFSQPGTISLQNYNGQITLYSDKNADPLIYRIDFPNPHIIPRVTRITVNGQTICSGRTYPSPSTSFQLSNILTLTKHTRIPVHRASSRTQLHQFVENADNFASIKLHSAPTIWNTAPPRRTQIYESSATLKQYPQYQQVLTATDPPYYKSAENYQQIYESQSTTATPYPQYNQHSTIVTEPPYYSSPELEEIQQIPTSTAIPPDNHHLHHHHRSKIDYSECGLENEVLAPYVVGGETLEPFQYPWLVAIYIHTGPNTEFKCGGTLVAASTVITAAHCFKPKHIAPDRIAVHLGRYDLADFEEEYVTARVRTLITHPDFKRSALPDADVAILQLQNPVSFSRTIRPICLWHGAIEINLLFGKSATVAGWGEDETRIVTTKPKRSVSNIVSEDECGSALERYSISTTSRTLCARSSDGSAPCHGDSGGGVMIQQDGRWYLRGVVSGGKGNVRGCQVDDLSVFCDLAKHKEWLENNIV